MKLVDGDGKVDELISLLKVAFAYAISLATFSTTRATEIDQIKHCGPVSTIMRLSTSQDGGLISYFDKIDKTQVR